MTAPAAPNPAVPTQAPTVGLSPLSPTKIRSRVAILVAAIGAFVTLRIDRFMAIAKDTDWLPPAQRDLRIADPDVDWCAENTCLRLPQDWVGIAVIVGIITTLLVLYALDNARLVFPVTATTQDRKPTITLLTRLWWGVLILGIVVAVLRVAVAYDVGGAPGVLLVAAIAQVGAVLISVLILARLAAPKKADGGVDWSSTAGTFRRQRATIVLVVLFALFLLVIPIATQQVADALRSLTFRTFAGGSNAAFLVATAALMSATVLQVWRAADRADAEAPEAPRGVTPCRWFVIGVVVVAAGLGLAAVGLTGWWGLTVLGLIFILFAVLERGRIVSIPDAAGSIRNQKADEARSRHAKDATPRSAAEREARASLAARYVAAIPLAALSIALVSAVVEMVIAEEPSVLQWLGPVVTAVVLGVLAVILTRTVAAPAVPRADDTPSRSRKPRAAVVVICVLLIVASVVLLFVVKPDSAWALAAGCAAAFVFMIHLGYVSRLDQVPGAVLEVRRRLPDAGLFRVLTEYGGTIPFAAASGLAVGLILHISPFDAARTLGTVALLDVFVAGLLGAGFYLSLVGRRYQAPWSLDWFGSKRLPVYTMLLVWWVIAGLLAPPALHDVRLVDREAGLTSAAPTLEQAFETWVAAQSDLAGVEAGPAPVSDDGSVPPPADVVPLVLVASHGGGIRAAYWTGLVLDCIIGANATAKEDSETGAPRDEEDVRTGACSENRRDDAQTLEAARRIFLASTVSGGAVGTAAYSQQILTGELTEGWIDERLSDDLLAPVIGWALFHDLPNHLVGLAPGVGGECRVTTGYGCLTQERAAILEEAIDLEDPSGAEDDVQRRDEMTLRGTWHERTTGDADAVALATAVPLLVFNSSTTGSPSRAVTSAADLSDWPQRPADVTDEDAAAPRPVSDAADSIDVLCSGEDLRISTAAMLAARFPYVSPTGRIAGDCDPANTTTTGPDCRTTIECQLQLSDGGDLENSGLMTLAEILPTLQTLVAERNLEYATGPAIAIVIVDIDNEYRDNEASPVLPKPTGETLAPATILLSGNQAMESAAYGLVQKLLPTDCLVTMAPALRPGIQAPLGWALSDATRDNLKASLVQPAPSAKGDNDPLVKVRLLQHWLTVDRAENSDELRGCVPD